MGGKVKRFCRGELIISEPTRSWREENGVIYFSVTSDGTTGKEWIERLEGNGSRVDSRAKRVLRSSFVPTNGVTTEVAVLKDMFSEFIDWNIPKVRAKADKCELSELKNLEVACLICEKFTDEEFEAMGLWYVVVMQHELFDDPRGGPGLLCAYHYYDGGRCLGVCDVVKPAYERNRSLGFAFAVSTQ